jgi:hypothetical protein
MTVAGLTVWALPTRSSVQDCQAGAMSTWGVSPEWRFMATAPPMLEATIMSGR